jgi:hypothetical protein
MPRLPGRSICRLEDADYDGHSLFMLKRIEIRFVPAKRLQPA